MSTNRYDWRWGYLTRSWGGIGLLVASAFGGMAAWAVELPPIDPRTELTAEERIAIEGSAAFEFPARSTTLVPLPIDLSLATLIVSEQDALTIDMGMIEGVDPGTERWTEPCEVPQGLPVGEQEALIAGDGCSVCGGDKAPGWPRKPRHPLPGDINRGQNPPRRYCLDDSQRAGAPRAISRWAKPSYDTKYSCGFVGGGAAFGGRGHCPSEGVWGLDYRGHLPGRRIWLGWTGGRSQGGLGAYQTDGHTGIFSEGH